MANVVTNSFIIAQGNGVSVSQDGSIIHDKRANDDITVRARSGWLVNGRDSVSLSASRGGMLKVMSRLGEDEEHVHVYPSETKDVHSSDIILGVLPKSDNLIAMYALPDTSTVVSFSATCKVIEKGSHEETTTYYPCECGEIYDSQETDKTYDVTPNSYEWTASCANRTLSSSTWTGEISKGLSQSIEFTVTGKRDVCSSCISTATTNVLVDVHELSVTSDLYLGLDRTDLGRTNPVVKTAIAKIDPTPAGSSAYLWTDCGICSFTGRTDQAEIRYFAPDPDKASESYLSEPLTVRGTATNAEGISASANCTTNFTVVKVDVTIGGVGEEKEEKEGAFIQYVADATNGVISVDGTNKFVSVRFTCEPHDLPENEQVNISCKGPGELYEKLPSGELVRVESKNYLANEISGFEFVLHGHEVSGFCKDGEIQIAHPTSGAVDVCKYAVRKFMFFVFVDQPGKGGDDDPVEGGTVGHAFWMFSIQPADALPKSLDCFVNVPNGFYPSEDVGKWDYNNDFLGLFVSPDNQHLSSVDVTCSWQLTLEQFKSGVLRSISIYKGCNEKRIKYNAISYNCVNAVIDVAGASGIELPANPGGVYLGVTLGLTCGRFGEDLRKLKEELAHEKN